MSDDFKPYLPGALAVIRDLIGEAAAIAIAKKFGGRRLYIPAKPNSDHALSKVVGLENAQKLSQRFGNGRLVIPCGNLGGAVGRRERIKKLLREGVSHSNIAGEVDVTMRTVERVAAEEADRVSNPQPRLL